MLNKDKNLIFCMILSTNWGSVIHDKVGQTIYYKVLVLPYKKR